MARMMPRNLTLAWLLGYEQIKAHLHKGVTHKGVVKGSVLEIDIFPIYLRVFRVFRG